MTTGLWVIACVVSFYVGGFAAWLVLGLCNAAAEGDRQAEQIRRAMREDKQD